MSSRKSSGKAKKKGRPRMEKIEEAFEPDWGKMRAKRSSQGKRKSKRASGSRIISKSRSRSASPANSTHSYTRLSSTPRQATRSRSRSSTSTKSAKRRGKRSNRKARTSKTTKGKRAASPGRTPPRPGSKRRASHQTSKKANGLQEPDASDFDNIPDGYTVSSTRYRLRPRTRTGDVPAQRKRNVKKEAKPPVSNGQETASTSAASGTPKIVRKRRSGRPPKKLAEPPSETSGSETEPEEVPKKAARKIHMEAC